MHGSSDSAVDRLVEDVRKELERVDPGDLTAEMHAGALVVDIRPDDVRVSEGEMPGALVVDRNVLEWRLDPTCDDRLPEADDPDRRVILFCNDGYASTLAADTLRRVGLSRATDLVGGYRAWRQLAD